jgi:hypothetical protein
MRAFICRLSRNVAAVEADRERACPIAEDQGQRVPEVRVVLDQAPPALERYSRPPKITGTLKIVV